jgi:two-component system sensor histidine kinase TctE
MLAALAAGEVTLLAIIAGLVFWGVDWGLRPLSELRREVDARLLRPELDFGPLPVASAPHEILPFVSAFNALLSHVEAAVETLQRFTSDASHQLRAPLAVVRTHVELLRRGSGDKKDMHEAITDMHAAVLALQHLTVQLIALAKAERPVDEIDGAKPFDLVGCARAAARTYAAGALAKSMDLSFESAFDELPVWGNAIFANEMIANLLDNAIRYGGPGIRIVARIMDEPGVLEIEDDGPGIPMAHRERVFERFYRMPVNLDRDGSGLGLSIVQALSRRMGARVSLETPASGRGLKAVIRFRIATASPLGMLAPRPVPAAEEFRTNQTIHVR